MAKYVMALDAGTTSNRCILFNEKGEICSMALSNIEKLTRVNRAAMPDVIEILPGIIVPKIMRKISAMSCVPVIAGGLIKDREDVMNMLNNGAVAISTSAQDVWFM